MPISLNNFLFLFIKCHTTRNIVIKKYGTNTSCVILRTLFVLSYYVSLRCEFCAVMFVTISVRLVFTSRCLCEVSGSIYVACVCLRVVVSNALVYPMLTVSLACALLVAPSVFSNVYLYR